MGYAIIVRHSLIQWTMRAIIDFWIVVVYPEEPASFPAINSIASNHNRHLGAGLELKLFLIFNLLSEFAVHMHLSIPTSYTMMMRMLIGRVGVSFIF